MSSKKPEGLRMAPHIFSSQSELSMVMWMGAALLPAAIWGIVAFGPHALLIVLSSVFAAVAAEAAVCLARRKWSLPDGTAILTGFVIGLSMPPGVSIFIPVIASVFAILVVKWSFGGLGANWMNPAMAGVAFAYVAWPARLSTFVVPANMVDVQGVSAATPIGLLARAGAGSFAGSGIYVASPFDSFVTGALNDALFQPFGASLPGGYVDLLVGNRPGAIGEVSILLLLLGSLFAIGKRIIRVEIPVCILLSFSVLSFLFGSQPGRMDFLSGDVLFALCSGSIVFAAFYPACDPVTSPLRRKGRWIYGLLIGCLSFAFRKAGAVGEGTAFAIIIADCLVPAIDGLAAKEIGEALG